MPVCVAIANGGRIGELKRVLLALHRRLRKSQGVGMRTAVSGGPCFVLCCVCVAWGDLWGEGGGGSATPIGNHARRSRLPDLL